MRTLHLKVIGRVQGVGFRYYTMVRAKELNLTGWVRNLADGSVEIEVTGDNSVLDLFVDQVRKGPSYSRVTEVLVNEIPRLTSDTIKGFTII